MIQYCSVIRLFLLSLFLFLLQQVHAQHQPSEHPRIYITDARKAEFQASLETADWKRDFIQRKKDRLEVYLDYVEKQPDWLLSRLQMYWDTKHTDVYLMGGDYDHAEGEATVPTVRFSGTRDWATDYRTAPLEELIPYSDDPRGIYMQHKETKEWTWVHPSESGHAIERINEQIISIAQDAALLYWLTGESKYAELAEPVFFQYIDGMDQRNPPHVMDESSQANISGLATFEVIHEGIVIPLTLTYDFLYDYFVEQGRDLEPSQRVFQKWGDQIIEKGIPDNNWNFFQARFLTYIAMALEDDHEYSNGKGKQYYLKMTFDESTPRQVALKESILIYDQKTGIWPESPSYSVHVTGTLLEILTVLDNSSQTNEFDNFPLVEKAALAAFQYLFPTGFTVGFGDSGHMTMPPENFEMLIANYRKHAKRDREEAITPLLQDLVDKGHYERKGDGLFELFFYVDQLAEASAESEKFTLITPSFYAPNVSMFVQRLGTGANAMMVSTVGSFGNHSQANGISMELFANGYVWAPDMGRGSSYWHPDFLEYYSKFPAHNTVAVDGKSTYSSMRSFHPYTLEASFPKPEVFPLFDQASFVQVSFVEPKTQSNQQRLTALALSPSGQGYALDIFRSAKIKDEEQMHDYFYHSLGQSLTFIDNQEQVIALEETTELNSDQGQLKAYDYFSRKKKSIVDGDLTALFTLEGEGLPTQTMKAWIKGQPGQAIYSVSAPKSNALSKGTAPREMLGQELPTMILRRQEEAWDKPFVLLFNPYINGESKVVQQVQFDEFEEGEQKIIVDLEDGYQDVWRVGISLNSEIDGEDYYQKGLLSLHRKNMANQQMEFLLGADIYRMKFDQWEFLSLGKAVTFTIQAEEGGFMLQNEQAMVLKVPMELMSGNQEIIITDQGNTIRRKGRPISDTGQIEFRLERPFQKVLIPGL